MLVFTRITSALAFLPVVGGVAVPNYAKVGLGVFVSAVIFPLAPISSVSVDVDVLTMGMKIAGEMVIGFFTSMLVNLIFSGVQLAGSVIGFQVGFGIVNVVDPVTSAQISITSQFLNLVALLLFLSLNFHHVLLHAVVNSFSYVPPGEFAAQPGLYDILINSMGAVYVMGVQIAAPLTVMLLLKQAAMGLIARTIPQMNIFIVGFPLTIAFGLFAMGLSLPVLAVYLERIFSRTASQVDMALRLMG